MFYTTDAAYDASGYQMFEAESRHIGASNEIDDARRMLRDAKSDFDVARALDLAEPSSVTGERRDFHYRRLLVAERRLDALGGVA